MTAVDLRTSPGPGRDHVAEPPLWRIALMSFAPPARRRRLDRWLRALPLGLVLAVQAVCAARLDNSAFQDEALYIHTGRLLIDSWTGGEGPYGRPETFFSGAPQLYPVWAGLLDAVGGLHLVRAFSMVCMLSATVAVAWTAKTLTKSWTPSAFRTSAGLFAAMVFALSASVMFLSNFATFDAPSFALIAWAMALAAWSSVRQRSLFWSCLVGVACALAVFLKYSSAIDVPFVLGLGPVAAWTARSRGSLIRATTATATLLGIVVASVLTWARPLLDGLRFTTTGRSATVPEGGLPLAEDVLRWDGVPLVLILLGVVLTARRRPLVAAVLGLGALAAPAYQIHLGESVSLHKHVVLGLMLGAPLAGAGLSRLTARSLGTVAAWVFVWGAFVLAVPQSQAMFSTWPDTSVLARQLSYSTRAMPWIRMVGDNPEPLEYNMQDSTHAWQWTATYENSFYYKGLSGLDAYRRALKDNYFQLVFFDGSYPISSTLLPELKAYGFTETSVVRTPYTNHAWHIYQRFDHLTAGG
jgi:Dolichyl-phosphate-mannose-protein mannosyltransferase